MKKNLFYSLTFCFFLGFTSVGLCSQKPKDIKPCDLIATEKVIESFPNLQKAENQTVGLSIVCNYLDKIGIPALVVSVSRVGSSTRDALSMLGPGYKIEDIKGLGDEAAIAIQQANPKFGLKGGVAALQVKKREASLTLSFFRIDIRQDTTEFEKIKKLVTEMLNKL